MLRTGELTKGLSTRVWRVVNLSSSSEYTSPYIKKQDTKKGGKDQRRGRRVEEEKEDRKKGKKLPFSYLVLGGNQIGMAVLQKHGYISSGSGANSSYCFSAAII